MREGIDLRWIRDRIDLRWIIVTTVVVAVAAAGTAATMIERGNGHENPEATQESVLSGDRAPQHIAQFEPARQYSGIGAPTADLPAFQSEALPPAFSSDVAARSDDARSSSDDDQPAWSPRNGAPAMTSFSAGARSVRAIGQSSAGIGWPSGSITSNLQGSSDEPRSSADVAGGNGTPGHATPAPDKPGAPGSPSASPVVGHAPPAPPAAGRIPDGVPEPPAMKGTPPIFASPEPALPVAAGDPGHPPVGGGGGDPGPTIDPGPEALSPTPEPGSLMLIGTGLVAMAGALRRRLK